MNLLLRKTVLVACALWWVSVLGAHPEHGEGEAAHARPEKAASAEGLDPALIATRAEIEAMPLVETHCHVGQAFRWTVDDAVALQSSERVSFALLIIEQDQAAIDRVRANKERAAAILWVNPKVAGNVERAEALWRANRDVVRGFKLHPTGNGYEPSLQTLEPLFALAAREDILIVTHTDKGPSRAGKFRPLMEKFPSLRIIFYHASPADEVIALLKDFPNAYVDMSYLAWGREYQQNLLKAVGPTRIVFGIDSPLGFPKTESGYGKHYRKAASEVAEFYDNQRDVVESVFYRNAERLLGMKFAAGVGTEAK